MTTDLNGPLLNNMMKGSHKNSALFDKIKKIEDPKLLKIYDKKQYTVKKEEENINPNKKDSEADNS